MTLAELLSDLRYICHTNEPRRATELDHDGAHLIELGWAERLGTTHIQETAEGQEVIWATEDVELPEGV